MRFLALYRPAGETEHSGPPDPEHMAAMGALVEQSMRDGSLISTEPLAARTLCAVVSRSGEEFQVSDVPERLAGFAMLNAANLDEAVAFAKQFLGVAGEGTCELRQVMEFGPPPT